MMGHLIYSQMLKVAGHHAGLLVQTTLAITLHPTSNAGARTPKLAEHNLLV